MQAIRSIFTHRGFAFGAIGTLGLGIAAATVMFSVVYGVLLRPLPHPAADQLVRLYELHPGAVAPFRGAWLSNLTYLAWVDGARTIGPIATFSSGAHTVGEIDPQRLVGAEVSPVLFDVLAARPALGRFFNEDDVREGAAPVVVVSDGMWREQFGGRPGILGQTVFIDRRAHEIVGVAPDSFTFPSQEVRFWRPVAVRPPGTPDQPRMYVTSAIARLAPGATPAQAAAEGTAAARRHPRPFVAELLFGKGAEVEVRVQPLVEQLTSTIRPALITLAAAVGLLLFIACSNVANLLLSRGVAREREIAVRLAVGASRGQIVRQLLHESAVIAGMAGIVGVGGAWLLVRLLPAVAPEDLPRLDEIRIDAVALGFAFVTVVVTTLISGLVPAMRAARPDLVPALRENAGASSSARTVRLRKTVLVLEAALAVVLLVGSGLLIHSFVRLMNVDPGYDATNVLTADIYLPGAEAGTADTTAFLNELLPRVRAMPGVQAAGVSNMIPLGSSTAVVGFTVPVPGRTPVTARGIAYWGTPGYAETLRLRLRAGRLLQDGDATSAMQAMVVNEEFARTFLDGVNPIGVQFPSILAKGRTAEIVGVVGNVLKDGLDAVPQPEVYVALAHGYSLRNHVSFVMRTATDPAAYVPALRGLLRELRPDAAMDRVGPLSSRIAASVAQPRFAAWVLAMFAGLALLLSAVGLYSVLAYTVSRRRRELGVRTALGASRLRIVGLVCRDGLSVATLGLVLGLAGAALLSRWLQSMLFGIDAHDAIAFTLAPLVLLAVALLACAIPAVRAARMDPAVTLRAE
jgi:putative ABC transport system permease protein